MASSFTLKRCPYCGTLNAAGASTSYEHHPEHSLVNFFGHCTSCKGGVVGKTKVNYSLISPASLEAYLEQNQHRVEQIYLDAIGDIHWFPLPQQAKIPTHLPNFVSASYTRAQEAMLAEKSSFRTAAHAFKQTIERALRYIRPTWPGSILGKIHRLIEEQMLPAEIGRFADALGNMLLEDDEHFEHFITQDQLHEMQVLTEQILQYLFTLPNSIPESIKERW